MTRETTTTSMGDIYFSMMAKAKGVSRMELLISMAYGELEEALPPRWRIRKFQRAKRRQSFRRGWAAGVRALVRAYEMDREEPIRNRKGEASDGSGTDDH